MRYCLLVSLFLVLAVTLRSQQVLFVDDYFEQADLAPYCRVLKIPDSTAKPNKIVKLNVERDFAPSPISGLSFGFEIASYWVTFEVENKSEKAMEWQLVIPNPNLYTLQLYQKKEDSLLLQASTGLHSPMPPVKMLQFYHFPIRLAGREHGRFYIFTNTGRTGNNPSMSAKLMSGQLFLEMAARQHARHYFFAAIYLIFILIAALMHYALRTRQTLWLFFFVLASVLFLMGLNGTFLEINWAIFRHLSRFFVGAASGFALIAFVMLFIAFYDLERILPLLAVRMRNLTLFFVLVMVAQSLRYWIEVQFLGRITYVLSAFYMLPILYILAVSGLLFYKKRQHRYLLFAEIYLLSLLNTVFLAGQNAAYFSLRFDSAFFAQIGFSIEFALLLMFIGNQILRLRRDHAHQQLALARTRAEAAENLLRGQQEERRRFRLRLHDGLGILLASARMRLSKRAADDESLRSIERDIAAAAAETRHLSHDLDPEPLREGRLFHAIADTAGRTQGLSGAAVSFSFDENLEEDQLPQRLKIALFYIAQELLHNALKHAEASEISLFLTFSSKKKLLLRCSDNGKGLEFAATDGIGLENIRTRVATVDGQFSMRERAGGGLVSEVEVQL